MRVSVALSGAVALAAGLLMTQPVQAAGKVGASKPPVMQVRRGPQYDAGCSPSRFVMFYATPAFARAQAMPFPQLPAYYPPVPAYAPVAPLPAYSPPLADGAGQPDRQKFSSLKSLPSANALPRPSGNTDKNEAPAEPLVRLRYVELTVTGLKGAGDSATLTAALDKMKGSRGSSVKWKAGGEATVKLWYSEKDPVGADEAVQAVTKLGFKAVVAGG